MMERPARQLSGWFMFRGITAILIGLLAMIMPALTFTALVLILGGYMVINGIFSIIVSISERRYYDHWGWLLASGILSLVIGIITLMYPLITGLTLIYFVAFWALVAGIAEIAFAIRLRREITGEGWYIAAGALTVLFALLVFFYPIPGAYTLTMLFGVYTLAIGILFLSLGIRLRRRDRHATQRTIRVA